MTSPYFEVLCLCLNFIFPRFQVYMALVMRGGIQKGESILIHAGAGGVGQAAIRVALSYNCNIFTTVGAKEKHAFLRKEFPQVK